MAESKGEKKATDHKVVRHDGEGMKTPQKVSVFTPQERKTPPKTPTPVLSVSRPPTPSAMKPCSRDKMGDVPSAIAPSKPFITPPCSVEKKDSKPTTPPCYVEKKDSKPTTPPCYVEKKDSKPTTPPCYIEKKDSKPTTPPCYVEKKDSKPTTPPYRSTPSTPTIPPCRMTKKEDKPTVCHKEPEPDSSSLYNFSTSEKFGYFEKQFKEVIKVTRMQNSDGTVTEEKQVITIRTEKRNPRRAGLTCTSSKHGSHYSGESGGSNSCNCMRSQAGRRTRSEYSYHSKSMGDPTIRTCMSAVSQMSPSGNSNDICSCYMKNSSANLPPCSSACCGLDEPVEESGTCQPLATVEKQSSKPLTPSCTCISLPESTCPCWKGKNDKSIKTGSKPCCAQPIPILMGEKQTSKSCTPSCSCIPLTGSKCPCEEDKNDRSIKTGSKRFCSCISLPGSSCPCWKDKNERSIKSGSKPSCTCISLPGSKCPCEEDKHDRSIKSGSKPSCTCISLPGSKCPCDDRSIKSGSKPLCICISLAGSTCPCWKDKNDKSIKTRSKPCCAQPIPILIGEKQTSKSLTPSCSCTPVTGSTCPCEEDKNDRSIKTASKRSCSCISLPRSKCPCDDRSIKSGSKPSCTCISSLGSTCPCWKDKNDRSIKSRSKQSCTCISLPGSTCPCWKDKNDRSIKSGSKQSSTCISLPGSTCSCWKDKNEKSIKTGSKPCCAQPMPMVEKQTSKSLSPSCSCTPSLGSPCPCSQDKNWSIKTGLLTTPGTNQSSPIPGSICGCWSNADSYLRTGSLPLVTASPTQKTYLTPRSLGSCWRGYSDTWKATTPVTPVSNALPVQKLSCPLPGKTCGCWPKHDTPPITSQLPDNKCTCGNPKTLICNACKKEKTSAAHTCGKFNPSTDPSAGKTYKTAFPAARTPPTCTHLSSKTETCKFCKMDKTSCKSSKTVSKSSSCKSCVDSYLRTGSLPLVTASPTQKTYLMPRSLGSCWRGYSDTWKATSPVTPVSNALPVQKQSCPLPGKTCGCWPKHDTPPITSQLPDNKCTCGNPKTLICNACKKEKTSAAHTCGKSNPSTDPSAGKTYKTAFPAARTPPTCTHLSSKTETCKFCKMDKTSCKSSKTVSKSSSCKSCKESLTHKVSKTSICKYCNGRLMPKASRTSICRSCKRRLTPKPSFSPSNSKTDISKSCKVCPCKQNTTSESLGKLIQCLDAIWRDAWTSTTDLESTANKPATEAKPSYKSCCGADCASKMTPDLNKFYKAICSLLVFKHDIVDEEESVPECQQKPSQPKKTCKFGVSDLSTGQVSLDGSCKECQASIASEEEISFCENLGSSVMSAETCRSAGIGINTFGNCSTKSSKSAHSITKRKRPLDEERNPIHFGIPIRSNPCCTGKKASIKKSFCPVFAKKSEDTCSCDASCRNACTSTKKFATFDIGSNTPSCQSSRTVVTAGTCHSDPAICNTRLCTNPTRSCMSESGNKYYYYRWY